MWNFEESFSLFYIFCLTDCSICQVVFNTVWHPGLIFKLCSVGIPLYLSRIIESFLTKRTFSVRLPGALSAPFTIKAGVPQGSTLSPTLSNVYTSDIPITKNTAIALFADDTVLYSS